MVDLPTVGRFVGGAGYAPLSPLFPQQRDSHPCETQVPFVPILLQKSQKAQRLIFRQRTKQATIADQ